MAVYTPVSAEALDALLLDYDAGGLVSAKGIAEGVENSNFLVDTTRGRFILTLYEKRVAEADLPFFLALMTHCADKGLPCARPVRARDGQALRRVAGRPAALIEFLPGVSVSEPAAAHAAAAGEALGRLHRATADFTGARANALGLAGWPPLAAAVGAAADGIAPGLLALIADELAWLRARWPDLPRAAIHADLFPDNVLFAGATVTGLIDFYFACVDLRAYDLAVLIAAWAFDGADAHRPELEAALLEGYRGAHTLGAAEERALPVLARGACLRFLLTRAYDWVHTPPGAMVTRKDPMAFARRLAHFQAR